METIIKFFKNKQSSDTNELISRTLLKISVISRYYQDNHPQPQAGELWRVKIIREMGPGTSKGCFIVEPIQKVEENQILHIAPGMYYKQFVKGCLMAIPKKEWIGQSCILPLTHKHIMAETNGAYAVIVLLDVSDDDLLKLEVENQKNKKKLREQIAEYCEETENLDFDDFDEISKKYKE